jgi:hypothetical protein
MPRKTRTRTRTRTSKPKIQKKRKQVISRRRNKKGGDDNDNKIIKYLNSIFINEVKIDNTNFFIVVSNTVPKCVVSNFQNIILQNVQNVEILNEIKEPISIMKCQKELGSVTSVILLLRGETPIGSFCFKTETISTCEANDVMITEAYNSIIQKVNTTNGNGFI